MEQKRFTKNDSGFICANCGKECKVPFQPREDRPVYCSECFASMKGEN